VIDRVGQSFVATERINEENAPVFMQRLRYPDCERDAQCDVNNGEVILVSKTSGPRDRSCFALTA
jgi:hypothetical protein